MLKKFNNAIYIRKLLIFGVFGGRLANFIRVISLELDHDLNWADIISLAQINDRIFVTCNNAFETVH